MSKLFNRVRVNVATTGTGTITLGSAVSGYNSFSSGGVANGDVVSYVLEDSNGNVEFGTGTYTASGTTLTRNVTQSNVSGTWGTTAITLSGSAVLFVTALAADILNPANNLSDVSSASTARTNLGLGTAATLASSAVCQTSNNLSDVANTVTARTNLGLAIGTNVQAWDADLDSIAGLAGTSGLLKKTAANTWSLDTSAFITGSSPTITTPAITFSTAATVTAGTNTQGQGALTNDFNVITTATANPSGVTLPTATVGRRIIVVNKGANPVNIFPPTSGIIDALSANASIQIASGDIIEFNASTTTQWYSNTLSSLAGTLPVASGGTGATSITGIVKGSGTSAFTAATSGTDYLAPPSGTAMLKANSGGALSNAVAGTDYLAPFASQTANYVYAAPNGSAGTPSFRALAVADVGGLGANVGTFLGTPSSANLASAVTDETGSGALVFGTSPTITTPTITFSTAATVTAGTNAQAQGALTNDLNIITTAASNPSGVTLPTATVGRRVIVVNKGANPVNVYPAASAYIDALAVNTSIQIAVGAIIEFNASSTTQWYSNVLSSLAGTLPVSKGGTGLTSVTANYIPYGNGTSALNTSANLTYDGSNIYSGGTAAAAYIGSYVTNLSSTGYATSVWQIGAAGANGSAGIYYAPGTFMAIGPTANDTTTPITFRNNNGTERMRIDASGNVLIGLTSQSGTACTYAVNATSNTGNAASLGLLRIGSNTGGSGYPDIGHNVAYTSTSALKYNTTDTAAFIRFGSSGRIETFTAASGTGGTTLTPSAGPYVATAGTSWTTSSDERLKDVIEPITGALAKLSSLRTIIGKYKTDSQDKRRAFLIAQDVQAVLPEAVDSTNPDSLGLNYTDVIPLLIAAVNELSAKVSALEAKQPS